MKQLSLLEPAVHLPVDEVRPVDSHVAAEDVPRLSGQNAKVLARLRGGPATNVELGKIASRFGARLKDLRAADFVIETKAQGGGLYLYTLISEPVTREDTSRCKCGKPHDGWPGRVGGELCQTCWEDECSASWWEMVAALPAPEGIAE